MDNELPYVKKTKDFLNKLREQLDIDAENFTIQLVAQGVPECEMVYRLVDSFFQNYKEMVIQTIGHMYCDKGKDD